MTELIWDGKYKNGKSADSSQGNLPGAQENMQRAPSAVQTIDDTTTPVEALQEEPAAGSSWSKWRIALQQVLPVYIAVHLAFLLLTYLATLFTLGDFSITTLRLHTLLTSWFRWDSGHYTSIATSGYTQSYKTAFFPLFPLLERGVSFLTHDPFVAGLLISNLAGLGMLLVLYRLVEEDFDAERAYRTAIYLSVFPTAFFFAGAYNESLFLFLAILSFYAMRRGNWWLAGLSGALAILTRSAGLALLLPFFYEYARRHDFKPRLIRFDILAGALIPAGLCIYALYCYFQFHDALAFSHAQSAWHRYLAPPWQGIISAFTWILHHSILSFYSIHNVIDLGACLLVLLLLILSFVGPWQLPRDRWSYGIYAVGIYLLVQLYPSANTVPMAAYSRYMLEVFPAFITLAAIGKNRQFNFYYLAIALTLLAFMLLQFLTGHWII